MRKVHTISSVEKAGEELTLTERWVNGECEFILKQWVNGECEDIIFLAKDDIEKMFNLTK